MKFLALLLLTPSFALASPFLTSDPEPTSQADKCVVEPSDLSAAPIETPTVNFACRIDLASVPAGTYTWNVWFRSTSLGRDSAKVLGFTFTLPLPAFPAPTAVKIVE